MFLSRGSLGHLAAAALDNLEAWSEDEITATSPTAGRRGGKGERMIHGSEHVGSRQ